MYVVLFSGGDQEGIALTNWYIQKTGAIISAPYAAIGFIDNVGNLCGVWLLVNYNGSNIEAHAYTPGVTWSRKALRLVMVFVFDTIKCNRFSVRIPRDNKRIRSMSQRIGFKFEGVMKKYYGPFKRNDAICYVMYREDALRWILPNGNVKPAKTAKLVINQQISDENGAATANV